MAISLPCDVVDGHCRDEVSHAFGRGQYPLETAGRIDIAIDDVRNAVTAEVLLEGGGRVKSVGDYIEEVRRDIRRDVEQARMVLNRSSQEWTRTPGVRL